MYKILFSIVLMLITGTVYGADVGIPALNLTTNQDGSQSYSVTLQVLALMTALTFLPAMLMICLLYPSPSPRD